MKTILIAERSEVFAKDLESALRTKYEVHTCCRGDTALALLESLCPDILIIDLMLPYLDGLSVLKKSRHTPAFILALAAISTDFVVQSAKDAGVRNVVLLPSTVHAVTKQLEDMLRIGKHPPGQNDPQEIIAAHLQELNFPPRRKGTKQLRVGIPLFSQDEDQLLMEQLYPTIASICGNDNPKQVESTIRTVIRDSWNRRDAEVWEKYFPGYTKRPANLDFLSTLAKKLK